ncbi:hypothetical protein WG901_20575 [Novosphingobium sp. PS1R-30]|uniref:Uncharacterized protein n=1 Tax=Novosphingobium anseongense TaxID=3133436 RepID=A0ABU8S158_9SPHN
MNGRLIDWIWTIRGSVELPPEQSREDAFDRLDPLFHESGTSRDRTGDALTFDKKDQAAQDKMSIFDSGVLWIEQGKAGGMLHYRLTSRALLFCFLAPLLFLAFAGLTIAVGKIDKPAAETAAKKPEKKDVIRELNPVDKFLGAPAPEKPKKDDKTKDKDEGPSPISAYVFAALFAVLYVVGRILEDRLIRRLFRKRLRDDSSDSRQAVA